MVINVLPPKMPDPWNVAIILVAFDNSDDVLSCLKSLEMATYRNFSIRITENAGLAAFARLCAEIEASGAAQDFALGDDGVWRARLFEDHRPIEIIASPDNPGYAGGVNRCLERLDAFDAIWILNPDTNARPDALAALVERARSGGFGIVGGRLVDPTTRKVQLYGGRWRRMMARGYNIGLGTPEEQTAIGAEIEAQMDYVSGACMLVSRAFIEALGPMREDYFLYCEEIDWCLRRGAFKLGYAHECLVYHAHGSTIGSSRDRRSRSRLSVYLDERNKLLLTRRLFPSLYPLVALTTLVLAAQYLRHGAIRNYLVALSGWWAGITGETGKPSWMR